MLTSLICIAMVSLLLPFSVRSLEISACTKLYVFIFSPTQALRFVLAPSDRLCMLFCLFFFNFDLNVLF